MAWLVQPGPTARPGEQQTAEVGMVATMREQDEAWYAGGLSVAERSSLLAKVAGLLAFAMVFTTLGAIVGVAAPGLSLPALIGVFILAIALMFARNVSGLNLII